MKKISKINGFAPKFEDGVTDLLFDKINLNAINTMPGNWELNEAGTRLIHKNEKDRQIVLSSICNHKVGETVVWTTGTQVQISDIKLIRLSDMTEEIALRSGVEKVSETEWKHYCPEKFYPKSVLNKQLEGYPRYNTAVGSFHSLWCKKHDMMDIYAAPWIWLYTCKSLQQ